MFKFQTKLLITIFMCLLLVSSASAEFFSDVIVTSPDGIWTDSRSYVSLQAAINSVGANDREIVIVNPQSVTNLTVPSNVRLKFLRNGSINNSGQLTINTRNITADDRQIFTGVGDIDFVNGSVVRSSWFSDVVDAFNVTSDDSLTMIISEPGHVTSNATVGNEVSLKWEAIDNHLIVYGGKILSNVKNITADNYQIFAGAGDIDFLDGSELYLSWFRRLRSVLTWVENERVTIIVNEDSLVEYTQASTFNECIKFVSGGVLNISAAVTLTLNGLVEAGSCQIFTGAGTLTYNSPTTPRLTWFSDLSSAVASIGMFETVLIIDTDDIMTGNIVVPTSLDLEFIKGNTIVTTGHILVCNGLLYAGSYRIFEGTGNLSFPYQTEFRLSWFSSLYWAEDAIGSFSCELIVDTDDVMTGNITFGSLVSLRFIKGNTITTTGHTLTINGSIESGPYRIFSGTGAVDMSAWKGNAINALWFGFATSASATTNGVAIANCVYAASGTDNGRRITIPVGDYSYDSTIIMASKGLSIVGEGLPLRLVAGPAEDHGVILRYTRTDATNAVYMNNKRHMLLSGVNIICDKVGGHTGHGVYARSVDYTAPMLSNVSVQRAGGYGFYIEACYKGLLYGCHATYCTAGAYFEHFNSGGVNNCEFLHSTNEGVVLHHNNTIRFESCTFEYNATGVYCAKASTSSLYCPTFVDCHFEDNADYDIRLADSVATHVVYDSMIQQCHFPSVTNVHIGLGRQCSGFLIGPNHHAAGTKFETYDGSGNCHGTFIGYDPADVPMASVTRWGATYRFNFISTSSTPGLYTKGIDALARTEGPLSYLYNTIGSVKNVTLDSEGSDGINLESGADASGGTILNVSSDAVIKDIDDITFVHAADAEKGVILFLRFASADINVIHNAARIVLDGATDWTPAIGNTLFLINIDGVWHEFSRCQ